MMQNIHDLAMFRFNFWPKPFLSPPAAHQPFPPGMENSSFIPNPLGTPALMVLASTAENHEGARMPGPPRFTTQDKDGPVFTSTASVGMYRPGEHFAPPLYAPVPPYGRHGLINSAGGSAFRPVSTESAESYHSAFSPAKRSKAEDLVVTKTTYSTGLVDLRTEDRHDTGVKPAADIKEERPSSLSSVTYDTSSETHSEAGDGDRGTPDSEGRALRKQRKKIILDGQTPCCPICGLTLRPGEVETHFQQELDKLEKIARAGRKSRETTPQGRKSLPSPSSGRRGKDGSPNQDPVSQARHDNYLRIQCNRQGRLSARSRNRKKKATEETVCPICNQKVIGTAEELNEHVELCLKRKGEGDDQDEPVDVEGDSERYEEYTWAGQTRIRAASMLDGGFAGSGFAVASSSRKGMDEDVDLNVDGDDSEQYGQPQFSEADIIPCSTDEPGEDRERQALRGAVLSTSDSPYPSSYIHSEEIESAHYIDDHKDQGATRSDEDMESEDYVGGSAGQIITALKEKLKSKDRAVTSKLKCLICMEVYKNPLTSIQCWHVHCDSCWLKTLGAKKLCPQCNMITSPADLRRIFL